MRPTRKRSINCSRTKSFPTFYDRDVEGIPRRWLDVVRQAMLSVTPRFSARRMVKQYAEEMYGPVVQRQPQPQQLRWD